MRYASENMASGGTSGQTGGFIGTASEENPVSAARTKVTEASGRVVRAAIGLQQIADGLYGEWGQDKPVPPSQPPRCGEFGNLHDKLDALHSDLEALEEQIARFRDLIPAPQPAKTR
jgi:hypothetical protein